MTELPTSARSPVAPDVAHIGHIELLTPRLEQSVACFTEVMGLTVADSAGDSVYLRGESEYERHGLKLTASADAGIGHIGIRTRNADALARRVAALEAARVPGRWTDGDLGHGPAYAFAEPSGHTVELY